MGNAHTDQSNSALKCADALDYHSITSTTENSFIEPGSRCTLRLYHFTPTPNILSKLLIFYDSYVDSGCKSVLTSPVWVIIDVNKNPNNSWYYISSLNTYGWANIPPDIFEQRSIFTPKAYYREHEIWNGQNYFLCNGRIMLGSDAYFFFLTNVIIALPSMIYFSILSRRSRAELSLMVY